MAANHENHMLKSLETFGSILENQTRSIHHLTNQYKHSKFSQNQLKKSLKIMNSSLLKGGKIVISGIGKSHKIGSKIVATLNSLSLHAALLHPSEALHGDLGILRADHHDCLLLISSSGKSPELIQLLPHISPDIPVILLTNKKNSLLAQHFQVHSLLYAELPPELSEESIYGLTAPTISTTLSLTLADAASIALAELYISDYNERKKIFGERHPGGAIGEAYSKSSSSNNSFVATINSFGSATSLNSSNNTSVSSAVEGAGLDEDEEYPEATPVVFDLGFDDETITERVVDEALAQKVRESKSVLYLNSFFKNELQILQSIALYDFVVIGQTAVVTTEDLKNVYRLINDHQYDSTDARFTEFTWRIKERFVGFR